MKTKKICWNWKATTSVAVVLASVALAGMASSVYAQDASDRTLITVSGQVLFRIRAGAGGYSAIQRAQAVQERLVPILSLENLTPGDITVRQSRPNQDAAIFVRDKLLVTVDRTLAQANGDKNPGDLAQSWATQLRSILPTVSVKQSPTKTP